MDMCAKKITVRFIRPPNKIDVWEHELVLDSKKNIISKFIFDGVSHAFAVAKIPVIENGYIGRAYEFAGKWFEIVKVIDKNNVIKGYYCNINEPFKRIGSGYEIFDLFIDLWVFPDGKYVVLDEDELGNAIKEGWISAYQAKKARETIDQLIVMIEKGEFPPEIVREDIKIISQ